MLKKEIHIFQRKKAKIYVVNFTTINEIQNNFFRLGKEATLRFVKPCNRCPHTTVNPETGIKDPEGNPLKALRQFRLLDPAKSEADANRRKIIGESPLFAVNYALEKVGHVEVGDDVFVEFDA
jgi:uncharacterized protein YcbX